MWQILKTELAYNKITLITMYTAAVGFVAAAMIWDIGGIYSVVPNTLVAFFVGVGFLSQRICKESRERQHAMLPQPRTQRGVTRMLVFVCFQGGIFVLWLITYLLNWSETPDAIWMMLTANALALAIKAVGFIYNDTGSNIACMTRREGWSSVAAITYHVSCLLTNVVVIGLLLIAVSGTDEGFQLVQISADWQWMKALQGFLRGPYGAVGANLLFFVTFYLSTSFSLPRREFASSR